ncbi:MAG: hypothetical protein OXO49_08350 [Gammaproteobacteria bacterium]|nr:hypothetical protein [Gammaproteobacteria bacterium]MDE0251516.1 hypothetical protein [Gammaproteobacteria bacterium]MDE0403474.1 hypothetical protein [Gammaproteobacteria bacterium]MDE0645990.1 hypothetical protein [Gammaproteobacteria bacterium]
MSINSFEEFSTQLGELPLYTPPVQLLVDVQQKIYHRRKRRQQIMQLGAVVTMFMFTIWIVVDQSTPSNPETMLADTTEFELQFEEEQVEHGIVQEIPAEELAASAIVLSVVAIDNQLEQLTNQDQDAAARQQLLRARDALKRDYVSVRNQDRISLFQKVSNVY